MRNVTGVRDLFEAFPHTAAKLNSKALNSPHLCVAQEEKRIIVVRDTRKGPLFLTTRSVALCPSKNPSVRHAAIPSTARPPRGKWRVRVKKHWAREVTPRVVQNNPQSSQHTPSSIILQLRSLHNSHPQGLLESIPLCGRLNPSSSTISSCLSLPTCALAGSESGNDIHSFHNDDRQGNAFV